MVEKEFAQVLKISQKKLQNAQETSAGVKEKVINRIKNRHILFAEATFRVSNILAEEEKDMLTLSKLRKQH